MRDLFSLRETSRLIREKYMLNLNIPVHNQVTFGNKSFRVKFVMHHKTKKDRDCLSKANLILLKRPGCTTLGWLLIITRCWDVDVVAVTNPASCFCIQILYNFKSRLC